MTSSPDSNDKLRKAIERLDKTVGDLPKRFGNDLDPAKSIFLSFLKGVASALGALIAIAVVLPIIIAGLRSINWVPLVGAFVSKIEMQIEQSQVKR